MDGSIDPYHNTTEGAEIFFRCNPGFVPAGGMRAVCGTDGRWNPDPATLVCACECSHSLTIRNTRAGLCIYMYICPSQFVHLDGKVCYKNLLWPY